LSTFLKEKNPVVESSDFPAETAMEWNFLITQDKINVKVNFA